LERCRRAQPSVDPAPKRAATPSQPLRVATCLTGQQRQLDLIIDNVARVLRGLSAIGPHHVFAVQPIGDSWSAVRELLRRTDLLDSSTTIETQRVHNTTAPKSFRPIRSGRGFMIEVGDCAHCFDMIEANEAQRGWQFNVVCRMRVDLSWEIAPPMPSPEKFQPGHMFVPHMSRCHGINDKFAVGARDVMRRYLRRMDVLPKAFGAPRRFYSEQFLRSALKWGMKEGEPLSQVHQRGDWMFCKMGRVELEASPQKNTRLWLSTSPGAWRPCTMRIVAKVQCQWMACDWCGRGCTCFNDTCTLGLGNPSDRSDPLRHLNQKLCHRVAENSRVAANKTIDKVSTLGRQIF